MKTSSFGIVGLVANNELALAPLIARGKEHTKSLKICLQVCFHNTHYSMSFFLSQYNNSLSQQNTPQNLQLPLIVNLLRQKGKQFYGGQRCCFRKKDAAKLSQQNKNLILRWSNTVFKCQTLVNCYF